MSTDTATVVRVALPVPLPRLFDYLADATQDDIGRCVRVPFGREEKLGVILAVGVDSDLASERLRPVIALRRDLPALPADWLALVGFASAYYHAPMGEVVALALPPGVRRATAFSPAEADPFVAVSEAGRTVLTQGRTGRTRAFVAALAGAGTLRRARARELPDGDKFAEAMRRGWVEHVAAPGAVHAGGIAPAATVDQAAAIDAVAAHLQAFDCWLLQGVTGSGKTEVYLRLAERALETGRQVLMLVPEIALTPQLEARVAARFPNAAVVSLHSAQAEGARAAGFVEALAGRADIVLGTRLAVFTPLPRLGLILLDEEHDASYKQQEGVRYSARDLAVWRARDRGVPVVLGSATPSLESWEHARRGRYRSLRLDARAAAAAALPAVGTVDTRRLRLDEGLSPTLLDALGQRLARGEQSLVFLNRRGYAPVLSCTSCGWISGCPHCSANLVVHLAERRMRCHHCGTDAPIPAACPGCGDQDIRPFGRGTQRVEQRLVELFPAARVLRVDRDAARTRPQWEALLARIAAGEADILVGTQMMAKGHDFPQLTFVGVIGADASLHAADFRAPERLFQQLMQVGGRAGRAKLAGEVLIQTEFPEHPLYRHLARHDFDGFAARELDERRVAGFPPFSHQAMLRADAPELDEAQRFLEHARDLANDIAPEGLRVFDAVPMRMTRLARRERAQLLVEADQRVLLQRFVGDWIAVLRAQRVPRTLRWQLDVDPLEV